MDDQNPIETLIRYAEATNICDELEPSKLTQIGRDVVKWAKLDDASRSDWKKRSKEAMDMALQVVQEKTFPWAGAANVKYPLITVAALQFNARAYPAIVNGNKIVKGLVNGADPDGSKMAAASRVSSFMNYQLLEEMPEWEEQTDKLLLALPIEGCQFKKTFFDPGQGRNVSEWIRPDDFIVDYKTKNLAACPRMTHRLWFYPQEIKERQLVGLWSDADLNISKDDIDDEKLQEFYEQHTLLDLDGDGYKEPYCVTVHCDSEKVVRIKANYSQETVMVSGELPIVLQIWSVTLISSHTSKNFRVRISSNTPSVIMAYPDKPMSGSIPILTFISSPSHQATHSPLCPDMETPQGHPDPLRSGKVYPRSEPLQEHRHIVQS